MENKESFAARAGEFLRQQGFYIVLALCLLIVGVAIALTALPREQAETAQPTPQQQAYVPSNASQDETLKAKATPAPTAAPTPTATPAPTPTAAPTAKPANTGVKPAVKGIAPVEGAVIWGFAMEELLYSVTLDQWTTHAGIDIASDVGTEVRAVLAGTVRSVYEDDALGMVVTVDHTNERTSLYANLDMDVPVAEGKKVNAGDVIGKVGDTAISECGQLPHLHFGFFEKGVPVDPMAHVTIPH